MGLFERSRFVWNEPWFFQQRIRTKKAWLLFSLFLLAIAGVCGAILFFAPAAANRLNLLQIVGLCAALAAAIWWVLDGTNTRRQAVLYADSIVVGGDMGKYSRPETYQLAKIATAAIVLPEESKWPAPALFFRYDGQEQVIGIESQASLRRLAQALHDLGVPTLLNGWEPDQESEFAKAFSWQATGEVVPRASIEAIPQGTPTLTTTASVLLMLGHQCWSLVVWLAITSAAAYYAYRHWNNLGLIEMVLLIGIPIVTLFMATEFSERLGAAAGSRGLVRTAKKRLRLRTGIPLNLDGDLLPVEIVPRDQFPHMIQKIHDMGFLQADHAGRRVLLEGTKERWSIPAGSISSLAIEEVQIGTPGQSAMGALHYYVVIRFAADGEREFGIRYSERDFGKLDDVKRAQGAVRIFETLEPLLCQAAPAARLSEAVSQS